MFKNIKGSYLSYFSMYLFFFMALSFISSLISIYIIDKGYTASHVGIVISSSLVGSFILQIIIGYFSNKYDERIVSAIILLLSAMSGLLLIFSQSIFSIALFYSIALGLFNSAKPVVERFATLSRFDYGKIRIWGTIGYAVGSQLGGYIYQYTRPEYLFIFFAIALIICVFGILTTKDDKILEVKEVHQSETSLIKNKNFIYYLLIIAIFYSVTNLNSTYLPSMFKASGLSVSTVSSILFVVTLSELPIIYFYHRITKHIPQKNVLLIIFGLLIIQFFTYGVINVSIIQVVVAILTKAVCTMSFIILNMKIIEEIVDNSHQIIALSIVSMINSLASILIQNIGGYIIDYYSYQTMYIVLFIMSIIGFLLCTQFMRKDLKKSFVFKKIIH